MSSNKPAPKASDGSSFSITPTVEFQGTGPDYVGLVLFLIQPFLESPESLKVDCEISPSRPRVWIRLAFESSDKGRVFGRGGRNIQAIRTVLEAAAKSVGQTAYLDIYGSQAGSQEAEADSNAVAAKPQSHRPPASKASPKLRAQ